MCACACSGKARAELSALVAAARLEQEEKEEEEGPVIVFWRGVWWEIASSYHTLAQAGARAFLFSCVCLRDSAVLDSCLV